MVVPGPAHADSGIPGPALWAFGSQTVSMAQWLAVTMAMCVSVEWAAYRYTGRFRRPFLASAVSNTVSLLAGIPLAFLGAVDPTWFILPTVVSIGVEYMTIAAMANQVLADPDGRVGWPVVWANVLSNLMLVGLLYVAWLKALEEFPDWVHF
jgi:hypothetical protein